MKTQIVLLSIAILAINSPEIGLTVKSSENTSKTISKPQDTNFAFFRTHREGKGVTATWGLTSTTDAGCFMVQRTYEDPTDPYAFWEDLNYVPCTSSRSFKWTDQNVFPGYISYRVVAFMYDGTTMSSEVSQVRVVGH